MKNYFWDDFLTEDKIISSKKIYILLIYDIVDNKRRTLFAKKMNGYGYRVQKSAFEAYVSESMYKKLIEEIPNSIDKKEDSVRIYKIQDNAAVTLFGSNVFVANQDVIIF